MMPRVADAAQDAYLRSLVTVQDLDIDVEILDLNGEPITALAALDIDVLDAGIAVDLDGDVARVLNLTLLDSRHVLNLDTDSPDEGALYADRLISVRVRCGGLWVPVAYGPISKIDRSAETLTVEVQGMEAVGLGAAWKPQTWPKGALKTDIIREILSERMGVPASRMNVPASKSRISKPLAMRRDDQPWKVASRLAAGMNKQLLARADGVIVLRDWPQHVAFTFEDGDGGTVTGPVRVSPDFSRVRNVVWVKGAKPKGKKKAVTYTAIAPAAHPLSPARLGPGPSSKYLPEEIEDDSIRTVAEAKKVAETRLRDYLREDMSTEFTAAPIYHLEPGDLCRLDTVRTDAKFRLRQYSVPLCGTGEMSVGWHKPTPPMNRRRGRKK